MKPRATLAAVTSVVALSFGALSLAACAPSAEEAAKPAAETPAAPAIVAFTETADVKPFTIGEFQAAALRDGALSFPNDNKTVAINKTKAEVDGVLTANGLPADPIELSLEPLIVRSADKVFLFDSGAGKLFGPTVGKLPATLAAAGIDPASVTDIFISHAHGDHVGGLVTDAGALAYANATIHISADEWAAMQAATGMAPIVTLITPNVAAFAPGADLVPGVKAVDIKGHTPGHSGYLITSGDQSLLYIGDMAHHSVVSVQQPDWTIAFDGDAATAQASRKEAIAAAAASGKRIYAPHFPFPGLGKFEEKDGVYVWTAE
jgi:glyoxylase-like metal-dependent hydrolase (beta-lactamase superfamily II)